jgi:hypothetical protein
VLRRRRNAQAQAAGEAEGRTLTTNLRSIDLRKKQLKLKQLRQLLFE